MAVGAGVMVGLGVSVGVGGVDADVEVGAGAGGAGVGVAGEAGVGAQAVSSDAKITASKVRAVGVLMAGLGIVLPFTAVRAASFACRLRWGVKIVVGCGGLRNGVEQRGDATFWKK